MRHGRHGPHLPFIAPLQIINFSAFASEFFGYSRLTPAHAGCTLDDERCANARSPSNRSSRAADASKTLWRACYGTGWRWRGSSLWLRSRSTWKRLNDPGPSEMVQNRNHYRWHEHYVNLWTRLGWKNRYSGQRIHWYSGAYILKMARGLDIRGA